MRANVVNGWSARADLSAQNVVEDLRGIFLALKVKHSRAPKTYVSMEKLKMHKSSGIPRNRFDEGFE